MNFKPFYVKTDNLTPTKAQFILNLAVENGALANSSVAGATSIYYSPVEVSLGTSNYVGVEELGYTYVSVLSESFGSGAVELTYEQALLHVKGEVTIESQKAIADEILDKCKAMSPHMILAGGAPRDWYFGNTCNDLDFYFSLPEGLNNSWYDSQIEACLPELKPSKILNIENPDTVDMYKHMKGLKRIIYATYKGQEINLIQMEEVGQVFRAVDNFSTSICKAWYNKGKISLHKDFILTVASGGIIFLNKDYEWTNTHPSKIVDRFVGKKLNKPNGGCIRLIKGSLEGAEKEVLRRTLSDMHRSYN